MKRVQTLRRIRTHHCTTVAAVIAGFAALQATSALGATKYWDVTAGAGNGVGGSGTWTASSATFSTTPAGDATLVAESGTDDLIFTGTAGVVAITGTLTAASVTVSTSGYTFTDTSATATTLTGTVTLSDSVTLMLSPSLGTMVYNSILGGTNSLVQLGGTGAGSYRINMNDGATVAASAPVMITTTTGSLTGFVATGTGGLVNFNAPIVNNTTANTLLGATGGNTLVMAGSVSGTGNAGVLIAAGASGGAGVVLFNVTNAYNGPTLFNGAAAGVVRLGINNALPTNTDLNMGFSKNQGQIFDLGGFDQTVGSLFTTSLAGTNTATGSITDSGTSNANGYNTLTIGGSDNPGAFGLVIGNGASLAVAITRTGTGVTTLTATNTYTGPTNVSGGFLFVNGVTAASSAGTVTSSGELAGNGSFGGPIAVQTGGVIAAGSNATTVGTLTTGSQNWNSGGAYTWKIDLSQPGTSTTPGSTTIVNATGAFDRLAISGLIISNDFQVNVNGLNLGSSQFNASNNYAYVIATTGTPMATIASQLSNLSVGAVSNFPSGVSASNFGFGTDSAGDVILDYNATSAAPEPTSLVLLGLVVTPMAMVRRRRVCR